MATRHSPGLRHLLKGFPGKACAVLLCAAGGLARAEDIVSHSGGVPDHDHTLWALTLVFLLVAGILVTAVITRINRNLRATQSSLVEAREELEKRVAARTLELSDNLAILDAIRGAQSAFIKSENPREAFDHILGTLLDITNSEYGFIGEVLRNSDGEPYLKTMAITNIAWNEETKTFYDQNAPSGLEFLNLDTLFGEVLKSGEALIANEPCEHPKRGGIPEGHPPLSAFLGIPLYTGRKLIGMAGVANCPGGYDESMLRTLTPFLATCGNLISAYQAGQQVEAAQTASRESETRLNFLLTSSPVVIYTARAGGDFGATYISENVREMMGYEPEAFTGNPDFWADGIHPHDRQKIFDELGKLFEHGHHTHEYRFRVKDGSYRWVHDELRLIRDEHGEPSEIVGYWADVDNSKRAEQALRDSETRQRAILMTMVDALITIDRRGIVESFNPAAERMFGYRAEEVIGRNINMLMPEPYHGEHDGYLRRYLETGKARILGIDREVSARRKDGSTFPIDLSVSEMRIAGEVRFTGLVRDITERQRIDKLKNEFISTVSHELRTPLTSIRGALGLIKGGAIANVPEQLKSLLEIANNNTERLLLLINDILDVQKIESGEMSFRFQTLDARELVQRAIDDNAGFAQQHGVEFRLLGERETGRVVGDADRLMQVLANLLSNAAKFSPQGSQIELSVARHHGAIRISVSDHGPGIPEDFQPKLFEKFTQSDATDTRQTGGTGLGLSITKAIVEKHGGRIDFISREGLGTTFFVDLPEVEEQSGKLTSLKPEHPACMLIVEDDQDVAALLRRMLAEAGFNADVAHSITQAWELLDRHAEQYLAITLDLQLGTQSGIELLKGLRDNKATRHLPVIVVSAAADENKHGLNGAAVGVADWINKPIDQERLLEAVRQARVGGGRPRVLHVEDDADVAEIVAGMLRAHADISTATNLAQARKKFDAQNYDLVLLDLRLPDGSGLELLDRINTLDPPPKIVIFSAGELPAEYADEVASALTKSRTSNRQLIDTIRRLIGD